MKLIAACLTLMVIAFIGGAHIAAAAVAAPAAGSTNNNNAATVGLYAPDRYDGYPDMCLMPMDFGYCRAKVKRYYFDMRRMKCAMFYWGGCAGNINNFKSLDECNKTCFIDDSSYEDSSDNTNNNRNTNNNKNNNNNNYNRNDNRRIGSSGAKTNEKNDNDFAGEEDDDYN